MLKNKIHLFLFVFLSLIYTPGGYGQYCDSLVPVFIVDLTGNPDSVWISSSVVRDGYCCSASGSDNCVEFVLLLDTATNGIKFDIASGAIPPGALYYEINCENPTPLGDTLCLTGTGPHYITFCKPGANLNTYIITTTAIPQVSPPITVSDGCIGEIYATGFQLATIQWTSIPFNSIYNSYLSCTAACDTVVVTAQPGYPPFVDYEVSGNPIGGCGNDTIRDTVRVYFVTTQFANITPANPATCFGVPTAVITANGSGGAPPYSYLWSTGITTQSITVGLGTYWVQIQDSTNCPPAYDTVTVTLAPLTVADFLYSGLCLSDGTQFMDTSMVSGGTIISWLWYFGDGDQSTIQNPLHFYGGTGTYPVTLIAQSSFGCFDTITKALSVNPLPIANFTSDADVVYPFQNINFSDNTNGAISWNWDFGDTLGISAEQNPYYGFTHTGIYSITLVVTNQFGCIDTTTEEIIVKLPPKTPDAFSPNGDGENDIFSVKGGTYKKYDLKIYNGWGELIFTSDDAAVGWDGTKNNIEQPVGVYVYVFTGITEDDIPYHLNGDLTLLR